MGNACYGDNKNLEDRFEVRKEFAMGQDPCFKMKKPDPLVDQEMQRRLKLNIRSGIAVEDDSKSVNVI